MRLLDWPCPTLAAPAAAGAGVALALGAVLTPAHAQTGRLNDTGQTSCYDASNAAVACNAATAGNAGTRPHQDGRYGRDAAAAASVLPAKTGGGAAGFDFTRLCWNGAAQGSANCTGTLVANTTASGTGTTATDWACTRDNVTGLVWSLQTQTANWTTATGASYPNAGHNSASRCGYTTGWRMPTRRELLSIVHNGLSSGPTVDAAYLPTTPSSAHWALEAAAGNATLAWGVNFSNGATPTATKTDTQVVRLVRSLGTPTIDTAPPATPALSIAAGAATTSTQAVALAVTGDTDDVAVTGWYVSESNSTPALGAFATTRPTSFNMSSGDGIKTVYAWTRDGAGNVSGRGSDTIDLVTNLAAPTGLSFNVASPTNNTTPTLSWSAVSGATTYEVQLNGGAWVNSNGSTSFTPSALGEGANTFVVRGRNASITATNTASASITVDTTAPTLTIDETSLLGFPAQTGLTGHMEFSENVILVNAEIVTVGSGVPSVITGTSVSGNRVSLTVNAGVNVDYKVRLTVSDAAGNQSTIDSDWIYV